MYVETSKVCHNPKEPQGLQIDVKLEEKKSSRKERAHQTCHWVVSTPDCNFKNMLMYAFFEIHSFEPEKNRRSPQQNNFTISILSPSKLAVESITLLLQRLNILHLLFNVMASAVEYGADVDTITNSFARLSIETGADVDAITDSLARLSIETEAGNDNGVGLGGEPQSKTTQMEDGEQIKTQKTGIPADKIGLIEIAHIEALSLSQAQKELVKLAAAGRVKMTVKDIIRIWQVDKRRIPGLKKQYIWIENTESTAVGYKHMLTHSKEFWQRGIPNEQLPELAEAATTIGLFGFLQGKKKTRVGRPVFGLNFYGKCFSVGVSVGTNGFVIGMNMTSCKDFKAETKCTDEDLPIWP